MSSRRRLPYSPNALARVLETPLQHGAKMWGRVANSWRQQRNPLLGSNQGKKGVHAKSHNRGPRQKRNGQITLQSASFSGRCRKKDFGSRVNNNNTGGKKIFLFCVWTVSKSRVGPQKLLTAPACARIPDRSPPRNLPCGR